jgi:hypothetical protein
MCANISGMSLLIQVYTTESAGSMLMDLWESL